MNELKYENQGASNYLVLKVERDQVIDSVSLGMITNNAIAGIAPTVFTQMDADKFIKYNISSKVPLNQFVAGVISQSKLVDVLSGIVNAIISAEDYMIEIENLLLDDQYIYIDVSSCDTSLICVPIENFNNNVDIRKFFKDIVCNVVIDADGHEDYFARILNFINKSQLLSLQDFKVFLYELKNRDNNATAVHTQTAATVEKAQPTPEPVKVEPQSLQFTPQPAPQPTPQPTPQKMQRQPASGNVIIPENSSGQVTPVQAGTQKKMSLFYLLRHYSKENKAVYNAQKEQFRNAPADSKKDKKPVVPSKSNGFIVPGAPGSEIYSQAAQLSQPVQQPVQQSVQQPVQQEQNVKPSINFGNTTVLSIQDDTRGLTTNLQQHIVKPQLVKLKDRMAVEITKSVWKIGKEKSVVDFFISDNPAISRSHANILIEGGKYFIQDMNSTNHTFVDGRMLQSGEKVEITHATKIRLANEDFEFRLQ